MTDSLKNLIVRNPAGRIFLVEQDPGWPAQTQLRRLDREPREQARIQRPGAEVRGWDVMVPRSEAIQELMDLKGTCRAMLRSWGAWPKPFPEGEYLIPGTDLLLNRLAQLVEDLHG